MNCMMCNKTLSGRQTKYCCRKCKNANLVGYPSIKKKRHSRKLILIEYKGGKCEICQYSKNRACLHFHHKDPSEKEFNISNKTDRRSIENLKREVDKCLLLCANCHSELHHPQFTKENHAM